MKMLYSSDLSSTETLQQQIVCAFLQQELHIQTVAKKFQGLYFVEQDLVLHDPSAISFHLCQNSKLVGENLQEEAQIYSWLQFFNIQVTPLLHELYGQADGLIPLNELKYKYANDEFQKTLKILDDQLKMQTFLIVDHVVISDIIICSQLDRAFRTLLTPQIRKKIPNLVRWFVYIRSTQPFVRILGKVNLLETEAVEIKFNKDDEGNEIKSENGKIDEKKQVKQQLSQKKQEQKQGQNSNKQGNKETKIMQIQKFKEKYQNSTDKVNLINALLSQFPQECSVWKFHYNSDVTEGKDAQNMNQICKEAVDKLKEIKKISFGVMGVFQNEEKSQYFIKGVMMGKSEEVMKIWKEHPSYNFYILTKLNLTNVDDTKIINEYLLNEKSVEGLTLLNSYKLM